ncbi:MAG: histidine--tRNA ligase [Candidatus Eisenbacteria bacterium]|uniref:Histidine--tRNA ligase n=1 Tax=Eiseniibacteriota bacterium TaxID=2212470 RepID=A0A7Y2EAA6_UNCEI|nr:histidine--tRNA ligase [Candidatus Eisenbacteria bacterium]
MSVKAPRGTQDILPKNSAAWAWVEDEARSLFTRFGFAEIRTPIFESTELFTRGVGEATDIVQKEMYTFADRKGRSLTLRPEGTASVARSFMEHHLAQTANPVKVFYMGPMFRYERPQAGRYRQHQQIGAEVLGASGPTADFEMIAMLVQFFENLGFRGLKVLLNSVGDRECRPDYSEALRDYVKGREADLSEDMRRQLNMNPLRMLDSKDPKAKALVEGMPSIQDFLNEDCKEHQRRLLDLLDEAGIAYELDAKLVRGLDYYTKTVFEVQHGGLGAQSAIGGGGRYDNLVEEVGGASTPAVGFSTGVERILMALEADKVALPEQAKPEVSIVVAGAEAERKTGAMLALRLRKQFRVDIDVLDRGLGSQMKAANKKQAQLALILGEEELKTRTWTLKDLDSGTQFSVEDKDLESFISKQLSSGETP